MGEGRGDSAAKWAQLGGAVGGVAGMVYGWVVSTEVKTAKHALEAFTWGGGGALCGAAVGGLVGLLLGRRSAVQGLSTRPLPVLNPEFTDRDEDLGWLRSGAPVAGRSSPVVQVLAGLSGTGKSQIAGRYLQEQDAAGVRWWHVPGDALREVFVGAAGLFDDVVIPMGEGALLAERVLATRSAFEQTRYPWLLVLDDVGGWDSEVLASVIPTAGNGQVVITSQNPLWDQPVGAGIREVSSLPVEFAASFLCARARRDDRLGAVAVAQRLGGLPLALEQAARFLLADRKLRFGTIYASSRTVPAISSIFTGPMTTG